MIVIAHDIRSLHNVGSIFRSCDAFGVTKLYLSGITGKPPRKEIAKVSLGSERRVPWEGVDDIKELLKRLKKEQVTVLALENAPESVSISDVVFGGEVALLLGNEVEGVDASLRTLCDGLIEIPMTGQKQSLNVSVATGIALFALQPKAR